MNRFALGAEELIELGRSVPFARSGSGAPVLVELGRQCTALGAPSAGRKPFFAGRPQGVRLSQDAAETPAPGNDIRVAIGVGVAAFAAAILFS